MTSNVTKYDILDWLPPRENTVPMSRDLKAGETMVKHMLKDMTIVHVHSTHAASNRDNQKRQTERKCHRLTNKLRTGAQSA